MSPDLALVWAMFYGNLMAMSAHPGFKTGGRPSLETDVGALIADQMVREYVRRFGTPPRVTANAADATADC